jgi:hypothetical protein
VDRAQREAIVAAAMGQSGRLSREVAAELANRLGCSATTIWRIARRVAPAAPPPLRLERGYPVSPPPDQAPALPGPVPLPPPAVDLAALSYEDALGVLLNTLTRFLAAERGDWAVSAARAIQAILEARHALKAPASDGLSVDAAAAAAELARLRASLPPALRRAMEGAA